MIAADTFRTLALDLPQVDEKPHFDKAAFRSKGKIFATLDTKRNRVSLRLSEADQSVYCLLKPDIAQPATGAWGKQGWTVFDINAAPKTIITEALKKAYRLLNPSEKPLKKASKKQEEQIQTLHPDKNKTNKKIALHKYQVIKDNLLQILKKESLSHTDLMEQLYQQVKDSFEGGVQWYGETVKLDLEARQIIERTGTKPEKYRLKIKKR